MILRSLELEDFGKFHNQVFELRRGMNLILGPNEAGKSTLMEAIPAVLFGSREVERFKPWGRNVCAVRLVFEGKDRTVEIRRDLLTDDVHLVERDDMYHILAEFKDRVSVRGRGSVFQEYRELLSRLLGIGDEQLFRATCFFGHRPQEWSGAELSGKLRTLIGGGGDTGDYQQIMDRLLNEHFELTRVNPWGRDKPQDRQLERLDKTLSEMTARRADSPEAGRSAVAADTQRIHELQQQIASDLAEYEKGVRYVEQIRCRVVSALPDAPATDATETRDEPETGPPPTGNMESRLTQAGLPNNLPPQTPELLSEAATLRRELAELQQPMASLQHREREIGRPPWLLLGGLVLAAGLTAGLSWWFGFASPGLPFGLLSVLLGLIVYGGWRHMQFRKAHAVCLQERNRLEQLKAAAQSRQALLSERCEALGLPSSAIDLVRLHKLVEQHRTLLDAFWQKPDPATRVPEAQTRPAPDQTRPAATAQEKAASNPDELAELEQRLKDFRTQLLDREAELERLLPQSPSGVGPTAGSEPDLVELKQRRQTVLRRIKVLREAIELLSEAIERFARSDLVQMTEEVSRLFGKLTRGRYSEVRLDTNMHPELKIDNRRWQPVERFSRGTVDALYLALRVALVRVRGDGRTLPLMLDDPFAHLDQQRLAEALNMVDLAAAQGQLILLSHNHDLARRAARERWHVVALGESQRAEAGMEDTEHVGQLHLL